jgi:hypothetical protein
MNSSRATLAMIGTAMIVRMIAAGKIPFLVGAPAEEREPAEERLEPRLEMVQHEGAEDQDSPQPEDHARDRRQHLDEGADHLAHGARRQFGQIERNPDR